MLHRFRPRLTYANVISTLCLFLFLGGGAYAAFHLPKNSVRSKNIVNGQVKRGDHARDQRTDWALINPKNSKIIKSSPGVTLSGVDQGVAWVNFHHSVAGRPIVATLQWPADGVISAGLCGGDPNSEEDIGCPAGSNDHRHVFVRQDPPGAFQTMYVAVLPK